MKHKTGVLLHISSLFSKYGIGDLGHNANAFIDWLKANGHDYWQILPLNYCGYGDSPYNPISAFAFYPLLISPERLYEKGLIGSVELSSCELPVSDRVDYELVTRTKTSILHIAADNYIKSNNIEAYLTAHQWHLKPFLAYLILKELHPELNWPLWPQKYIRYSDELYAELWIDYSADMKRQAAIQAIFEEQLHDLVSYAHQNGIKLIGDVPLYLSYESSEVWAHQELFELDAAGKRLGMAGVPPDAFAEQGQLWGNPIYRWDVLSEGKFDLFMRRFDHVLHYCDYLRLDHFIGYVNYWRVDCKDGIEPETAIQGEWIPARPEEFFTELASRFGREPFIAEDLGILNDYVCHIRDSNGFPGMIILQFCFEESVPDVAAYPKDRFLYTGTHDNSTSRGWWEALSSDSPSRFYFKRYCASHGMNENPSESEISNAMISIALQSGCERIILPMQDILGLGNEARMNVPGTPLGNWTWRMKKSIHDC